MNRQNKPGIIVVTGAESTGKSVLTRQLARHFGVPAFAEFAREYIENLPEHYTYQDVESIARMQHAQMCTAKSLSQKYVLFDTWLIITMVWFEVVYGKVPSWIPDVISNAPVSLFLVCDTDIPWVADPVRENGGEMRERLQVRYLEVIRLSGIPFQIISGDYKERLTVAADFISHIRYNL